MENSAAWDEVREQVEVGLAELRDLLTLQRSFLADLHGQEPDSTRMLALSATLHFFYNGVENLFKRIARKIDRAIPKSEAWPLELLTAIAASTPKRPAVISGELKAALLNYLSFRHFVWSGYSHRLKWERMAPLAFGCDATFDRLVAELSTFFGANL